MLGWLIVIGLLYLSLLFAGAWFFEQKISSGRMRQLGPYIYALSLAVFCTAWTFYGSIGRVISSGLDFMLVYLGPTVMMLLWWHLGRKLIRIKKTQGIGSLADFISGRYGKSAGLGMMVALLCMVGVLPYISLQIKAVSESFSFLAGIPMGDRSGWRSVFTDPGLYVTVIMAGFTILFGTRYIQVNKPRNGLIATIAVESLIKLLAFGIIGVLSVSWLSDNFSENEVAINGFMQQLPQSSGFDWMSILLVSSLAVFLLPRQFQMGVVEGSNENNLRKATWLFPLYMLVITLFVLPLAISGNLVNPGGNPDYYILSFTNMQGPGWSLLAFVGGLSAATSMLIVSTLALGNMLSTYVLVPRLSFREGVPLARKILITRRWSIGLIMLLAYAYYHYLSYNVQLVSIGITSFVAVAQFAPAFFGALFWKDGKQKGAKYSIGAGFVVWFYFLVLPSLFSGTDLENQWWMATAVANAIGLSTLSAGVFFSLSLNVITYTWFSINTEAGTTEANQAELYVEALRFSNSETPGLYRGTAPFPDIKSLLIRFLGNRRTEQVLDRYARLNNIDWKSNPRADSRVITYAERLLSEVIGPASARIMINRVVQQEEISVQELVQILQESQRVMELNQELRDKSEELRRAGLHLKTANTRLQEFSDLKDEFLYTVTHELRTPLTSIRAQAEIIMDDELMAEEDRSMFLDNIIKDCDRLTRLISNVLDLEKFESGSQKLILGRTDLNELIRGVTHNFQSLARQRNIDFEVDVSAPLPITYADNDRITQVVTNLLSNAFKYCDGVEGKVLLTAYVLDTAIKINITDNGSGIPEADRELVFDKFYQVRNQTRRKPSGSGLGLAICKNIVQMHRGNIWIEEGAGESGTRVSFTLPIYRNPDLVKTYEENTDRG